MTDSLDRWVDEDVSLEEAGVSPLADLLRAARRGSVPMADAAPASAERFRAEVRRRRHHRRASLGTRVLAGLAATLAALALSSPPPPRPAREALLERVVVKHLFLESVQDGKVRILEMTLHRTQKKEKTDVSSPVL